MRQFLLERLREITEEEEQILRGSNEVEKERYATGSEFTVDSRKMLAAGQLITVRKHTRFVRFPLHRHTFVEMIYVCQGKVVNLIGGKSVEVRQGELLFLNQYTKHEILPSGMDDLAVNFMVLPEFFDVASRMIGKNNVLADFLVNILRQNQEKGEYLHFKVAEILPIQNLMENMILSLLQGGRQNNRIDQTTMGLLFMHLVESAPYIEMVKAQTGYNFTELLLRRRMNKATQLLCDTDLPVNDVIAAVGYENNSYFHRMFKERYNMTPRAFRIRYRQDSTVRL